LATGAALRDEDVLVIVVGDGRCSQENGRLREGVELRGGGANPFGRGLPVEMVAGPEERPAKLRVLVDEDDPRPGSAGGDRGCQTGRSTSDH
jgi:hypothetical protein